MRHLNKNWAPLSNEKEAEQMRKSGGSTLGTMFEAQHCHTSRGQCQKVEIEDSNFGLLSSV